MSQPTAYYPAYNFTQYQVSHPSTPLPAASVDAELFNISASIAEICTNLALIQRDDGQLANGSVGMEQLATSLFTGVNAATVWTTGTTYAAQMSVYHNNAVYLCAKAHTSGVFATDLAAGDWIVILDFSSYVTAASGSATAAAASAASAAVSAASLQGTSATSVTIGAGAQTFTTQSGKFFTPGAYVAITSNANPTVNFMNAQITSYSGTSLVVNVQATGGSGAHTDWTISVSGAVGATGPQGSAGAGTGDMLKANNLSELANFATARANIGLGSAALQANSFFAQVANNLSDVSNAATAFSNIKQTGTSSVTGALQLATSVEAVAGADTAKAVTSAGVAAAIAAHSSAGTTQQSFTASGTWSKPANYPTTAAVLVQCWGAGASGATDNGGSTGGGGGGGGQYVEWWTTLGNLAATVTVTIGAGGAARGPNTATPGAAGGNTTFGALVTALGGGAGTGSSSGSLGGNGGGFGVHSSVDGAGGIKASTTAPSGSYFIGGGGGYAGASSNANGAGAATIWSGAGGGGSSNSTITGTGGVSMFGGGGSTATIGGVASAGTQPGGGGGGSRNGTSGKGGDGQCIVTVFG